MKRKILLAIASSLPLLGVDTPLQQVPIQLSYLKGSFSGQLSISVNGTFNKAKNEWDATIRNTSDHKLYRATFCVRAFDAAGRQIRLEGGDCVLTMWGSNWESNASLNFKGKRNVKLGDGKEPIQVAKYEIIATEILDHSPNLRNLDIRCGLVWGAALMVFADQSFRPTVMDKDSLTASFAFEGGRIDGREASRMLKTFTTANTAFLGPTWDSFRVDSASIYLREEKQGACTSEVKMSFAGFGKPFMGTYGWFALDSNFAYEAVLLDALEEKSKLAKKNDLDKAISQLPNQALPTTTTEAASKPQLTISSVPVGAEIEIDGEFIGNTPTTVVAKSGKVVVKVKKTGFQTWERTLTLNTGDKRSLSAEMVK